MLGFNVYRQPDSLCKRYFKSLSLYKERSIKFKPQTLIRCHCLSTKCFILQKQVRHNVYIYNVKPLLLTQNQSAEVLKAAGIV